MRIEISPTAPKKRKISTIQLGEAFRYGQDWYIKADLNDGIIRNFDDFYEDHVIFNMSHPSNYSCAVGVLHLTSQQFCYANGDVEADEWCSLVATLKTEG